VRAFASALAAQPPDAHGAGRLMLASHASYGACGLGSAATDRLVELVGRLGADGALFGARITGGGSGGTVAVLGRADAGPVVDEVAATFARETGHPPHVFSGSSPGAAAFGHVVLR
jgi:L-arabinokinase